MFAAVKMLNKLWSLNMWLCAHNGQSCNIQGAINLIRFHLRLKNSRRRLTSCLPAGIVRGPSLQRYFVNNSLLHEHNMKVMENIWRARKTFHGQRFRLKCVIRSTKMSRNFSTEKRENTAENMSGEEKSDVFFEFPPWQIVIINFVLLLLLPLPVVLLLWWWLFVKFKFTFDYIIRGAKQKF